MYACWLLDDGIPTKIRVVAVVWILTQMPGLSILCLNSFFFLESDLIQCTLEAFIKIGDQLLPKQHYLLLERCSCLLRL